jgi:putative transcriptional regulator
MKTGLAPGFLIASPALPDPNFARSVVLMCIHNSESALGLIVNRPAGLSVRRVFEDLELGGTPDMDSRDVLIGGPVQPHQGWVLYAGDGPAGPEEIEISRGLRLSASRAILERIASSNGPSRYLLLFGYAGWGPLQLESEIGEGSWLPAELDEELIFAAPLEQRWELALASLGINPAFVHLGAFGPGFSGSGEA